MVYRYDVRKGAGVTFLCALMCMVYLLLLNTVCFLSLGVVCFVSG